MRLSSPPAGSRRGFTLTELLVAIGILSVLIGITFTIAVKVKKQGASARAGMDMQSISSALEAFKTDFKDYPRPGVLPLPDQGYAGYTTSGCQILGYCLGTKFTVAPGSGTSNVYNNTYGSASYGPYLRLEGFVLNTSVSSTYPALCDASGMPILYFPARVPPQDPTVSYVADRGPAPLDGSHTPNPDPMYDHGMASTLPNGVTFPIADMRYILGDLNLNGQMDNGETPVTLPYLLWMAGPDGRFGNTSGAAPAAGVSYHTDDVTNFPVNCR